MLKAGKNHETIGGFRYKFAKSQTTFGMIFSVSISGSKSLLHGLWGRKGDFLD
jgi:hypothetical protein